MKSIQLHTDMPRNITMIPNEFLDHYMSGANGEFLKIYLYLIRWPAAWKHPSRQLPSPTFLT